MSESNDSYLQIEQQFKNQTDRWHLETSLHEKKRFQIMLELCMSIPHKSILEIGCAEGHFTKLLTQISDDVTAIDLSPTAISRAKRRAPKAKYVVSTLENYNPERRFDLLIASEILYYLPEKEMTAEHLKRLGVHVLTSTFLMRNYRGYISEWYLRHLKRIRTKIIVTFKEKKLTIISLLRTS